MIANVILISTTYLCADPNRSSQAKKSMRSPFGVIMPLNANFRFCLQAVALSTLKHNHKIILIISLVCFFYVNFSCALFVVIARISHYKIIQMTMQNNEQKICQGIRVDCKHSTYELHATYFFSFHTRKHKQRSFDAGRTDDHKPHRKKFETK